MPDTIFVLGFGLIMSVLVNVVLLIYFAEYKTRAQQAYEELKPLFDKQEDYKKLIQELREIGEGEHERFLL